MKKYIYTIATCLFTTLFMTAQTVQSCGTYQAREIYLKNVPGYAAKLNAAISASDAEYQSFLQNKNLASKTNSLTANYTFTVPVVFHILHLGEAPGVGTNVNESLCINALAQVNKDFARQGADTASIDPLYKPLYINSNLHFALAKKDPNGNCTNGIIHHYDPKTNWLQSDLLNYQYSTMAAGNWNPTKYLNVYVVKNIVGASPGIIVAYTHLPGTAPIDPADAIVYNGSFLSGLDARSLSHEIGHWLGLGHTFGNSNNAGEMCGNDDIDDTPRTSGFFSNCPLPYVSLNDSCDPGKRPNINNFMDYSSCASMFTKDQTEKMRFTAQSMLASRQLLVDTTNLKFTGILDAFGNPTGPNFCSPIADFAANKIVSCEGQSVVFNSTSYNATPSSYSWVFEGGTPATSSLPSQAVVYSTPGTYSVSLTISNSVGVSTKTVNSYISINNNSYGLRLPYSEGFENGTLSNTIWSAKNLDFGTVTWESSNYGSGSSAKSVILPNANALNSYPNNIDYLESSQFDLSNTTNISFSFDYSFARKTSVTKDTFKLQYSLDCGGSWITLPGSPTALVMSSSGGTVNAPYIPWSSVNPNPKWVTKTIPSTVLNTLNNKRNVKFRFWFINDPDNGQSQNLYIDNINISGTVGLHEFENSLNISIYPNPTTASSVIEFTSPVNGIANISLYDVTGRMVEQESLHVNYGMITKNLLNRSSDLKPGIYFVNIEIDNKKVTKKIIIQ